MKPDMKEYQVMMHGRNFLIDVDGKVARHGFFQNCFVEADSPTQAEERAVQQIRGDDELRALTRNAKEDPPILDVESMVEIKGSHDGEDVKTGKIWYREKRWWQFWK